MRALTSGLSQPIISPYDTWWQRQYVGSLGSTGISKTSEGCTFPKLLAGVPYSALKRNGHCNYCKGDCIILYIYCLAALLPASSEDQAAGESLPYALQCSSACSDCLLRTSTSSAGSHRMESGLILHQV